MQGPVSPVCCVWLKHEALPAFRGMVCKGLRGCTGAIYMACVRLQPLLPFTTHSPRFVIGSQQQ
jgi:hypothetical protein